ncbi:hypothetical protein PsorP6_004863 [Peronosclerospora sorghi]|uniref:Uncharacterized protein n=1 Tax=Peronosclerospora sorghi TaxID=230839 RepID=A0ACC0W1D2_9STRA|nr:hypothetical protein PsorP6_004863 [Peronosclerospora sorghi]
MFKGKDRDELNQTIARASTGATGVDVDVWEAVAQQFQVYQARARLTELHEEMLTKLADIMEEHETRAAEEAAATRAASTDMHGMVDEDGRDARREGEKWSNPLLPRSWGRRKRRDRSGCGFL